MKRQVCFCCYRNMSRILSVMFLLTMMVGCKTLFGGEGNSGSTSFNSGGWGLPIPIPSSCPVWDATKEITIGIREKPAVESALDRVNTAARVIEIGDLIIHTLPISGGSDWPKKVSGSVPMGEEAKLQQILRQDPIFYSGAPGQTSAFKLRTMYLQTLLFNKYPDLYAPRRIGSAVPSEAEVKALATKVLGPGYSPSFTKIFYRFHLFNPAFEPRADLFAGRLDGKATEVYPSLLDAVVSLAENKPEILQAREALLQAEEKKAKERRDIADIVQRIQKLESQEFGHPSTVEEAVKASVRETHAKDIEELKAQLEVAEKEFNETVRSYKEELQKLSIEMAKIKTQLLAFTPEQRALAANIQTAVDAVQGTMCQAEILLGLAGYHLKTALPNWKAEVKTIANQRGQAGSKRIERVTQNLVTLLPSLSILSTELRVLDDDVKAYDELFASRVTMDTAGGDTSGGGWRALLPK